MNIEHINNIIPEVIEWSATKEPDFSSWLFFNCCDGTPFEQFEYLLNLNLMEQDKVLGIVSNTPFDGNYDSDEVHDYQVVYFLGEYVGINHKIADKSSRNWYWKNETIFGEIISYLLKNFMKPVSSNEVLTDDISIKSSSSQYQQYIKIDGETFAVVNNISWGNIGGKGIEYLLTADYFGKLSVVGEIKKIVHGPRESYLIDYSTVTLKDNTKHVIWFHDWKRPKDAKEYFYAKKVMK